MLERVHEHINLELQTNTRTDTIFVVIAIVFNFVMLGINSGFASSASSAARFGGPSENASALIILVITLVLTILVNGVAIIGLLTGRATRIKLVQGLLQMYKDSNVAQYYDASLLFNYMRRYVLFVSIIALVGIAAIAIPLVILVT